MKIPSICNKAISLHIYTFISIVFVLKGKKPQHKSSMTILTSKHEILTDKIQTRKHYSKKTQHYASTVYDELASNRTVWFFFTTSSTVENVCDTCKCNVSLAFGAVHVLSAVLCGAATNSMASSVRQSNFHCLFRWAETAVHKSFGRPLRTESPALPFICFVLGFCALTMK